MQTDEQKLAIVNEFIKVQPNIFPLLAATDYNVSYFDAILRANWTAEFSVEWLTNAVTHFKDKFQWLQEPSGKPVLTKKEKLALTGMTGNENEWRPERWDKKAERIRAEEAKHKQEIESDTNNILEAKRKAEDLARTAIVGNHGRNESFRKLLSETVAYKNTSEGQKIDWHETYRVRKCLYENATTGW